MYQKKCYENKHVDLLLIGEGEKKHYVLIKDFNTFMYYHTLHRKEEILSRIRDCFKRLQLDSNSQPLSL